MKKKLFYLAVALVLLAGWSMGVLAQEPQPGGTLSIAVSEIAPSLDPHHNMGYGSMEQYIPFNTLIAYNQDLEFIPELAVSWEIPDNTTYIFHLRKGVTFHDGTEFDAEAVKFNFERMLSDYSQVKSRFEIIDKVTVIDKYTVKVTLKEPFAPFMDNLVAVGYIVSPKAVQEMGNEQFQKHPVGTGPFKFVELDRQKGVVVFEKFEDYFQEGKPYLDKIVIKEIPEEQTRLFALQTGKVDYLHGVPASSVDQLKKEGKFKLVSILGKSNTIDYLTFNTQKPPFDKKEVRLAVAYALDEDKILQFLDHTEPITGPLPETSWGSNPDIEEVGYDPEKAKELLAKAGYPEGFDVTLKIWNNDPQRRNLALITKNMLSEVGIDVKIEVLEASTLIQQMSKGEYEFASLHWGGGGALDPNGNLRVLFSSKGQYNWISFYQDEVVDACLELALRTTDREKRQELYRKAEKRIYEDHPMIWFGRFVTYSAYSPKVHGVEPIRPAGYFPEYENLWIEH